MQTHNQQEVSDSSTPGSFDRAAVIDSTSNQCGTPPLSRSSEVAPKSSAEFPRKLRSRDCGRQRGRSRSSVVDRTPARIQQSRSCPTLDMVLTTDASKSGWGATDQECSTGGMWTQDERTAHINCLEMKAALLALQTFASAKQNIHILLLLDNSSAIAYINHKGGTHSKVLSDLALEIFEWCLTRRITIHAEHTPGVYNTVADAESWQTLSRGRDSSRATGSYTRGFSINFRKYGGLTMWTFLQHGTTDSSLIISASDQTQKRRQWMLWLSAVQL